MPAKTKTTQPQTPNVVQGRDTFQTPRYATEILIPFIPFGNIWECASGEGRMAEVLKQHYSQVKESDLNPRVDVEKINFLYDNPPYDANNFLIITNPPFSLKRKFYERCMELDAPFALLIPADYCLWIIESIVKYKCEKIIPKRRIDYITPNCIKRINEKHGSHYSSINMIPDSLLQEDLHKYKSDFHSLWLTRGFGLGQSETFVELTNEMKENV